jgi:hypothetical protein
MTEQVFENIWGGKPDSTHSREHCTCLARPVPHSPEPEPEPGSGSGSGAGARARAASVAFHGERQDTTAPGWLRLHELIDEAAADGREEFRPLADLAPEQRRQIVTLPPAITKLTQVRRLVLYGSNLVRIPPQIGAMAALEEFDPYTSHRLHWFPYEITRCAKLRSSTVSTRALFGNYKHRPPFPLLETPPPTDANVPDAPNTPDVPNGLTDLTDLTDLDPVRWGATSIPSCSVCDGPVAAGGPQQVWISLLVATDTLPLLVNACSPACVAALPSPQAGYYPTPHTGGPIEQPRD